MGQYALQASSPIHSTSLPSQTRRHALWQPYSLATSSNLPPLRRQALCGTSVSSHNVFLRLQLISWTNSAPRLACRLLIITFARLCLEFSLNSEGLLPFPQRSHQTVPRLQTVTRALSSLLQSPPQGRPPVYREKLRVSVRDSW